MSSPIGCNLIKPICSETTTNDQKKKFRNATHDLTIIILPFSILNLHYYNYLFKRILIISYSNNKIEAITPTSWGFLFVIVCILGDEQTPSIPYI